MLWIKPGPRLFPKVHTILIFIKLFSAKYYQRKPKFAQSFPSNIPEAQFTKRGDDSEANLDAEAAEATGCRTPPGKIVLP